MKKKSADLLLFTKLLVRHFIDDQTADLAATLAYYFLLSLFPLFIFLFAVIPYLGISPAQLMDFIAAYLPEEALTLIQQNLDSVFTNSGGGLLSIGVIATLWTASGAVNALIRALNRAYRVEETRPFLLTRLLAVCLTVAMVFAIAMTLTVNVVFAGVARKLFVHFGFSHTFADTWAVLGTLVSFCVMIIIFAVLYRLGPNSRPAMREVIVGAVVAGTGWQLLSYGFSFYVRYFGNYASTYGTLGGIIILMLWFYLTAIMIIVGGQINAIIRRMDHMDKNQPF